MRTHLIMYIIAAVMTILGSPSNAYNLPLSDERYELVINDVVLPFLDALKNGDVDSIKYHIAGDIYENKRILLEKNKEYSEFLRNYYRDAEFYIENVMKSGDYLVVHVVVELSSGDEINTQLYLFEHISKVPGALEEASWKIIEFRNN